MAWATSAEQVVEMLTYIVKQKIGNPMSEFENVTVAREANVYFDGQVTSRTIHLPMARKRWALLPGEYTFDTAGRKKWLSSGKLMCCCPALMIASAIDGAHVFNVPANAT